MQEFFCEKRIELRTYIRPVYEEVIFWPRWCIRSLLALYRAKVSMNRVAFQDLKKLYDSVIHLCLFTLANLSDGLFFLISLCLMG